MQRHGQRLAERRQLERQAVRHRQALLFLHHHLFAHRPLHVRIAAGAAEEEHGLAMVGVALAAIAAHPAGARRIQRHAIARLDGGDGGAHFQHLPRRLVARRQRFADDEVAHFAVAVIVQVGPADAHGLDTHPHLRGAQRLGLLFVQAQVLGAMNCAVQHGGRLISGFGSCGALQPPVPDACAPPPCAASPDRRPDPWRHPCPRRSRRSCCPGNRSLWGTRPGP
ncbi:hypothetical protein G6F22_015252 [Rhizopus arrhizus]|nr:hypothetical protein G6F22_015252 [Rhizopus arrhizus]